MSGIKYVYVEDCYCDALHFTKVENMKLLKNLVFIIEY